MRTALWLLVVGASAIATGGKEQGLLGLLCC